MSSFLSSNTLLSDDMDKSSTLEDMYKALLGSGDAPSSFGNFAFSSDEEDPLPQDKIEPLPVQNTVLEEPPKKQSVILADHLKSRPSLTRQKPLVLKSVPSIPIKSVPMKPESSSSSEYEDDDDDDDDDDEKEEEEKNEEDDEDNDEEESDLENDYDYVDNLAPIKMPQNEDNDVGGNVATEESPPKEDFDKVQQNDVITDAELEAILDFDEDVKPELTTKDVTPSDDVQAETPNVLYENVPIREKNLASSVTPVTSTPIIKKSPPTDTKINIPVLDVEANYRLVNGIPVTTADSETTTDSEEEKEPQVVIVTPSSYTNNIKPPIQTGDRTITEKKQAKGLDPVKLPVKQVYEVHDKFRNETSYRCCVCCLVTLFCFTIAAFVMSLVAITDRCACTDTTLLKSQLLLLMEERNCPVGWRFHQGSCYGMPTASKKSFINANFTCNQYGWDLVTLTTSSENDFFSKNILCPRSSILGNDEPFLIGLNKANSGNAVNKYSWTTGEKYTFTNSLITTNSNKHCVSVTKSGVWTEVDCSTRLNFFCETKLIKNTNCGI